ncbi:MAG TPA: CHASE domain-containing protein [Phycisphaerales bacterium]|nr:CHASE domain-containing protein [Phycisphaerales bacterium]
MVVFAIGLACTLLATIALHRAVTARDQERFAFGAAQAREAITSRLETYAAMLRASAALYAASERVSRQEFQEFVGRLELARLYPGIQGIGFTARSPDGRRESVEALGRSEWAGVFEFRVWPPEPARDEYHAVLYLEPLDDRNRRAIGFDMYSQPARREAMERARDTGMPAMSGPVRLVQEVDEDNAQPGFLVYVPVYRNGTSPKTIEERRAALVGFVYSPFRATDLFTHLLASVGHTRTGVEVYDGVERTEGHLLYSEHSAPAPSGFTASETVTFAGRTWTIDHHALPGFEQAWGRGLVLPAFLAGTGISALLALIAGREARARAAADHAREQSRAATAELRQTLDTAAVGLVRVSRDLRYIAANPGYAEIAGLPVESIAGRAVREVVGDKGLAIIRPYIDRVLAGERVEYEADMPWVAAGNKRIHVVYTPWREPDGTISGWVASITDVTARAAAEHAMRISEARKTAVLETALDAVISMDADGKVVDFNPAAERIFGYRRDEVVGREMADLIIPPQFREAHRHGLRRHLAGGPSTVLGRRLEITAVRKNGEEFPVELSITRTAVGGIILFTGYIRDITERRRVEESLRSHQAYLSTALSVAQLGTFTWNLESDEFTLDERAREIFAVPPGPVAKQAMFARVHPDDLQRVIAATEDSRKRGVRLEIEYCLRLPDGSARVVLSMSSHVPPGNGQPERMVGVFAETTERRRADERLRQSEARFRSFFESLDQGFCLIESTQTSDGRPDYRFIEVNHVFEEQTGLTNVVGRSMRELRPAHEEHWFQLYHRIADTGVPERFVDEARALNRWYDVYAARVGGEGSRTVAVLFRDITNLRRSQARDRLLLALEDATRAIDDPHSITQAAARMLGQHLHANRCAYADVEGDQDTFNLTGDYNDGVGSIVGRYTFAQFGAECLRLMRANQPFVVQDSETDARCEEVRAAYRATDIRSVICVPLHKAGRFAAAMAVHQTSPREWRDDEVELVQTVAARCWESIERARVARDLRAGEERYRAFIANSSEGIWRLEIEPPLDTTLPIEQQLEHVYKHAHFAECNDVMARMYGLTSPEDLIGKNLEMMLPSSDPSARAYITHVLETGYRVVDIESQEKDANGRTVYFSNSMVGVRDPSDPTKLLRVWGTQRDITARRAAEEELARYRGRLEVMVQERTLQLESAARRLRDSERLASLGTLTAGLGHDLHNALLPMRVHVEELEEAARTDTKVRQSAAAIAAVLGYLSELSRGMRMLAMDPSQEGATAVTNPTVWQADAGRIFQSGVGRGVGVTTRADAGCPPLAIAPHRLTQAVFNLVQNAREAVHARHGESKDGRIDIHVRSRDKGAMVEVAVTDNGAGMTEEVRRRCMEPFFTTRTRAAGRSGSGTGMGLSIVAGIVTAAGGRVEIDSAPGQGSTFRLLIPAAAPMEGSDPAAARPLAQVELKDPRQAAYVSALLTTAGFDVRREHPTDASPSSLVVVEPATASPREVHALAHNGRRALVLNVPADDHNYESDRVLLHRRGQPLTGLREVVGGLTSAHGSE